MSWNIVEEVDDCDADCNEKRFYNQSAIILMNEMMNMKCAELIDSVEE